MRKIYFIGVLVIMMWLAVLPITFAAPTISSSAVPVPPDLAGLPNIVPEAWVQIEDSPQTFLEGPAFDRAGNLFVSSVFDGRIFRITPDKKVTTIVNQQGLMPDGIAIHKDGRLFIACLTGKIMTINPDGSNLTAIEAKFQGKPQSANDLVFDQKGNFYVTDFTGTVSKPTGGVYRFSADLTKVQPVVENLASANGVRLSAEGNVLWVSETARNALLRLELQSDGISLVPITGNTYPYHFTGFPGPDSLALDQKGNVYQALIFQGRVQILNRSGIPLANVLLPDRDKGKHLGVTNLAFKPGTDQVYMTVFGDGGAWIYRFKGLAPGVTPFSHQ
jgi:lactonase